MDSSDLADQSTAVGSDVDEKDAEKEVDEIMADDTSPASSQADSNQSDDTTSDDNFTVSSVSTDDSSDDSSGQADKPDDEPEEEDIFNTIGAKDIPEEDKGVLLAKMLQVIQTRTLLKIMEALPEGKDEELDKVVDGGDPDALEAFLEENVPNYSQIFEDEAKKLRKELEIEFSDEGGKDE